ncbi:MAG: TetR family transcriptional regulator C-terminal domain-containing protein [Defluviitaleaceae bacterium]|nr:TetR family transcriptional regulator C-terminal domain-containing protein [Defluviitaleaceae bacterium]
MGIENKEDRRVRKTKKALREGLIELLNEKSIQNITIRELTDKVDIHRSTFYANFTDVYELYGHVEDSILQEISDIISADNNFEPNIFFRDLLEYINSNRQISRLFFGGNTSAAFFERLTGLLKNACIDCWCKEYSISSISEEMDYYVQFCLSGWLGAIGLWVARDFAYQMEALVNILSDMDASIGKVFGKTFS